MAHLLKGYILVAQKPDTWYHSFIPSLREKFTGALNGHFSTRMGRHVLIANIVPMTFQWMKGGNIKWLGNVCYIRWQKKTSRQSSFSDHSWIIVGCMSIEQN